MEKIHVTEDPITLGQFLKLAGVIDTGGAAKWFLSEYEVFVNGEPENRRGKKLADGDQVEIPDVGSFIVQA